MTTRDRKHRLQSKSAAAWLLCAFFSTSAYAAPVTRGDLQPGRAGDTPVNELPAEVVADPTPSEIAYFQGLEALVAGQPAAAKHAFEESLRLDSGQFAALLGLAELAHQRGESAEAERLIRNAIAIAPRSAHPHASLGRHLAMQGKLEEAEAELLEAAQLDPGLVRPRIDLADMYATMLNQPESAAQFYRQVIDIEENHAGAHFGLGGVLERLGDTAQAAESLEAATRIEPGNPLPLVALARLYLRQSNLDASRGAIERALEIAPRFTEALELRGDILARSGELQQAAAAYDEAIASNPRYVPAYMKAAMVRQQAGDTELATRDYLAALDLDPENAVAYNNLAWMAVESGGDLAQAQAWAERAVSLAPQQASFHDTLGWTYRARGQLADAETALLEAAQLPGSGPGTFYRLGQVRLEQGKTEAAATAFEQALRRQPDYAPAREALEALR